MKPPARAQLPATSRPFTTLAHGASAALGAVWNATVGPWATAKVEDVIRKRLRGYVVRPNHVDFTLPERLPEGDTVEVAVVGGGLAGIAAAANLAERGFTVTLFEAKDHLGGKLGAWTHTFEDGSTTPMEHGFHAFFGSYYNLDRFLTRIGADKDMVTVDDYVIITRHGAHLSFKGVTRIPLLNLIHTVTKGIFDWRPMLLNPRVRKLDPLLHYDKDKTYAELDDTSFEQFAKDARLPADMQLMFLTFARAFFARADQMSMAALIRSFHLYYLSNDCGLGYRYPRRDHGVSLLEPMRAHLESMGVEIKLSTPLSKLNRLKSGKLRVGRKGYDHVVLAVDSKAARRMSHELELFTEEGTHLAQQLDALVNPNRYAVLRIWTDKDLRTSLPVFLFVEKLRALDSVTVNHRSEVEHAEHVKEHGGAVLELHSYEVPENLGTDEEICQAMLKDLVDYFPELEGLTISRQILHTGDDFSAFFVGMQKHRPGTASGIERLWLAGDWVDIPHPAMLMEGAFTSGMEAANAICAEHGVRQAQVYSVPHRGILDGN